MGMKIHDETEYDLPVSVPDGWPALNVSQFQKSKSLGLEVDADLLLDVLTLAADEVTNDYDMDVLTLPLEDTKLIYFRLAVFELALAKLLPSLPVNNQHDSDATDPAGLKRAIELLRWNSIQHQKMIPGYQQQKTISSALICGD